MKHNIEYDDEYIKEQFNFEDILKFNSNIFKKNNNTEIVDILDSDKDILIYNQTEKEKIFTLLKLNIDIKNKKKNNMIILIVENTIIAEEYYNILNNLMNNVQIFYPKEYREFNVIAESREQYIKRMETLREIERKNVSILIVPVLALFQQMINKEELFKNKIIINKEKEININELIKKIVSWGYKRTDRVEVIGTFSVRGSIIDIALNSDIGARIEFWGDNIESIRFFSLFTQKSIKEKDKIVIYPAYENILTIDKDEIIKRFNLIINTEKNETIKTEIQKDLENAIEQDNYFNIYEKYLNIFCIKQNSLFEYIDNTENIIILENIENLHRRIINFKNDKLLNVEYIYGNNKYIPPFAKEDIKMYLNRFEQIFLNNVSMHKIKKIYLNNNNKFANNNLNKAIKENKIVLASKDKNNNEIYLDIKESVQDNKKSKEDNLIKYIKEKHKENKRVVIFSKKEEVINILKQHNIEYIKFDELVKKNNILFNSLSEYENQVIIFPINIKCQIEFENIKVACIGLDNEKQKDNKRIAIKEYKNAQEIMFQDLTEGDLVVHKFLGIAKFVKLETVEVLGVSKEYLKLEYFGGDYLYVPMNSIDNIRKYIGGNSENLRLSKLGTKDWENAKAKVKSNLREVAEELVKLYAIREKQEGFKFSKDTKWQKEFEDEFEYEETSDQLRCIDEIKRDMENTKPMDRLLCGDVGFGKTEVAMRAAFKAVNDGKQVAYLVPTTVLARQQYLEFKNRMKNYPINISVLSRMQTNKENEKAITKLKNGDIDIIIGTHRLISDDVKFHDLGLLIIDEEHKFGVQAKEKIKFMKKNLDVLTLSATPIPRTMQMSLSGMRDMSVIYEPPAERKSVQTYLIEEDDNIIKEAILKEVERKGQVFFIHNRIETMFYVAKKISELIPNITVDVANGRMSANQTQKVMEDFVDHKTDVLVCTSILESGIDIPNANTIIISNADKLGLAQLYQMRGRVGRSKRQAYAYLLFNKNKTISENAEKRLKAIRDFTSLGSGYQIAMKDLEIRGAGSLLGEMQHGHLEKVGYDMYFKLLNEVINEIEGNVVKAEKDIQIDLNIDSYIPNEYIESDQEKIEIYRIISQIDGKDKDIEENILNEIQDRFGKIPSSIYNIIDISKIKNLATTKNILKIQQFGNKIKIYIDEGFKFNNFNKILEKYANQINFNNLKKYIELDINCNPISEKEVLKKIYTFINEI